MKIIYDSEQGIGSNIVLTFGNFDGVHLGHTLAISTVKKIAQEKGLSSAVLTFEPHPSTVLANKNNFRLIEPEQKKELISSYGVDYLYIINFNEDFSQISCDDFISKILIGRYNAKHIIVGDNCTFGHKRSGNILTLKKYSEMYGYSLTKLEPLIIDDKICSSSSIREYVQTGGIEVANKLLGRPYQVSGIVTKGACRGREIGFPTINIPIEDCMIKPKFGTYYARVALSDDNWLYGVVNVGMRPTFKDLKKPIIEMHIFDFNQDLYDRKVKIQLLKFIRPEKKFHSVDELTKQINYDILNVYQLKADL
ncbi:riboflavin biosynthesis protein RibF [Wolbachia endosymbiont of Folsomia candida]|uniref:riboflavin biosynthesis protein RibF n=1 Tax=Wolbachia endosymbiont of Folsomia candida TaxID=169402 RepID=UPI000AE2E832|nr:riboflavin biosynthesis protein RibF [Wolbachia endosymbiont of Folsomia candida]APR99169.1 bifunctional riboflavin kinase/FMN adenylyltransferase [Wolbachia endosymbiont of Folsomia candida]